jgi:hypothetical protein
MECEECEECGAPSRALCEDCGCCRGCCMCDDLFDADELGLDPEDDDERRYGREE